MSKKVTVVIEDLLTIYGPMGMPRLRKLIGVSEDEFGNAAADLLSRNRIRHTERTLYGRPYRCYGLVDGEAHMRYKVIEFLSIVSKPRSSSAVACVTKGVTRQLLDKMVEGGFLNVEVIRWGDNQEYDAFSVRRRSPKRKPRAEAKPVEAKPDCELTEEEIYNLF